MIVPNFHSRPADANALARSKHAFRLLDLSLWARVRTMIQPDSDDDQPQPPRPRNKNGSPRLLTVLSLGYHLGVLLFPSPSPLSFLPSYSRFPSLPSSLVSLLPDGSRVR